MAEPVIRFHVDCDDTRFFWVEVYASQEQAVEAIRALRGSIDPEDAELRACCLRYVATGRDSKNRRRRSGELGTIFFVAGDIPNGAVVHEMTHAAIYWARRTRVNPLTYRAGKYDECPEEKFAYQLQSLVEQFDNRCPVNLRLAIAA